MTKFTHLVMGKLGIQKLTEACVQSVSGNVRPVQTVLVWRAYQVSL